VPTERPELFVAAGAAANSLTMPPIRVETLIAAPPMRCFDLARSVEAQ